MKKKTEPQNPLAGMNLEELTNSVVKETSQNKEKAAGSSSSTWDKVVELAQAYKEKGGATVPITLDEDVKKALDILRGGTKLPAKHLVSAIVRQFIDENKDRIGEAVMKNLD